MSSLLVLTSSATDVLPSLGLLSHKVTVIAPEVSSLLNAPSADCLIVDARTDLPSARSLCRVLATTGLGMPMIAVVTEGGLMGVNAEWGIDDVVLTSAGPSEVEARIRLAVGKRDVANHDHSHELQAGELVIDEHSYTAKVSGRLLDLTFKEFELLKFLVQHPGRVFTRAQLLQDVWGYDYYGGTRTVDVHVRRLRAKLGPEYEYFVGTVRNVGYRFVPPVEEELATEATESV